MELAEALKTAIKMEENVQSFYETRVIELSSTIAKKIFQTLAVEESDHVKYLNNKLVELKTSGSIVTTPLRTAVPDKNRIDEIVKTLRAANAQSGLENEVAVFQQAFEMEKKVAKLYKTLVESVSPGSKSFFEGFLEIEEGHESIIQAELFAAKSSGIWFDFIEFDQEAG